MSTATQSLCSQLERAQRAWRASPLPAFLAWWGGELRALLPASVQQALQFVWLDHVDDAIRVALGEPDRTRAGFKLI